MNQSDEAARGNCHFPLRITKDGDGYTATSPMAPGKSWKGADECFALQAAQRGLITLQEKRELQTLPRFMTDGSWAGTVLKN